MRPPRDFAALAGCRRSVNGADEELPTRREHWELWRLTLSLERNRRTKNQSVEKKKSMGEKQSTGRRQSNGKRQLMEKSRR